VSWDWKLFKDHICWFWKPATNRRYHNASQRSSRRLRCSYLNHSEHIHMFSTTSNQQFAHDTWRSNHGPPNNNYQYITGMPYFSWSPPRSSVICILAIASFSFCSFLSIFKLITPAHSIPHPCWDEPPDGYFAYGEVLETFRRSEFFGRNPS